MDDDWFVGRSDELSLLRGLVAKAADGRGGVVLLEGEQGIGKSALLRAALPAEAHCAAAQAGECRLARASAGGLGWRLPLRIVARCVTAGGRPGRGNGNAAVGSRPRLAPVPRNTGSVAGGPAHGAAGGLLALIDQWCRVSPVVLIAEDLHYADGASVLVWHQLSRAVVRLPMLLVGSCRPGQGTGELARMRRQLLSQGGTVVSLGPLADQEVSKLVSHLAGGRPGRRLAALLAQAGGNPLYVRELTSALAVQGRVRVRGKVADLTADPALPRLPASLAASISDRLGSFCEDATGALRWAAVLGQEFSVTDLEVVTGRSAGELMGVVDTAMTADVLAGAGARLEFRHGLIRQVLYESMPGAMRAALHLQAARAFAAAGAAPERIAAQLVPALETSQSWEPWVADWLTGAVPALTYRVPRDAAALLRGVIARLADNDPRRERLETALVTVASLLALHEEVEQVGLRLLARESDPDKAAEITWLVGYALMRTGRTAEAAAAISDAQARSGVSAAQAARLNGLRALIFAVTGEAERAQQVATNALAGADRSGDRFAAGYALHTLSRVSLVRCDSRSAIRQIDRALEVIGDAPQTTDLRLLLLGNRTAALGITDHRSEAIATGRRAVAAAEQAGSPRLGMVRFALASQLFQAGQWDDALAELEPVTGLPVPADSASLVHGLAALICGHRDDAEACAEHLRQAQAQPSPLPSRPGGYLLLLVRALLAEQAGRPADAAGVLARCLRSGGAENMPSRYLLLPTLERLALRAGDPVVAAAASEAAEAEAQREPLPVKTAAADHCRGLLSVNPAPVLAAAKYYERAGRPFGRAAALEDAAVLAAARGDIVAAREAFNSAISLYSAMGAKWDLRRASARLRPYRIRRRGSRRAETGWNALTPTEVKIAHLVATGKSNPEIAAQLFLSRNTVQTHVSHILAKLDAKSRAEIAREALQHRLPRPPDTRTAS